MKRTLSLLLALVLMLSCVSVAAEEVFNLVFEPTMIDEFIVPEGDDWESGLNRALFSLMLILESTSREGALDMQGVNPMCTYLSKNESAYALCFPYNGNSIAVITYVPDADDYTSGSITVSVTEVGEYTEEEFSASVEATLIASEAEFYRNSNDDMLDVLLYLQELITSAAAE